MSRDRTYLDDLPLGEMLGAEGVSRGLVRLLRARLPVHIDRLRRVRSLTAAELPDVPHENFHSIPQPFEDLQGLPSIMVALEATDGRATNRQESGSGSYDELVMQYRVTIYVHARGPESPSAALAMQRLVLATRGALLAGRTIGNPESGNWGEILPDRLREGYTDPVPLAAGTGFLAGGFVEFNVQAHEMLWTDSVWNGEAPRLQAVELLAGQVPPSAPILPPYSPPKFPQPSTVTEPVHPAMEDEPETTPAPFRITTRIEGTLEP